MALDWLREPISDEEPCGPDLEATDNDAFIDYYYEAESRMPERYFTPAIGDSDDEFTRGTLFDKKSINHKDEKAAIEKLLKQSRDLRLLSLLARMMILSGRLEDFADAVCGIADVMEEFPNDVHPRDLSDRRGTLDELGNSVVVGIPLQYAELAGAGEVSLRRYQVAAGLHTPREGEVGLVTGTMLTELGAPGNAKAVDTAHAALVRISEALARIKSACLRSDNPFNPALDQTTQTLSEMMDLINSGRNDLEPWSADGAAGAGGSDADGDESDDDGEQEMVEGEDGVPVAAPKAATPTVVTSIPTRADALQTIQAIETYFATHEPAAPALLLITQARLLVGKPLVEAIETLLPAHAANTRIELGSDSGFVMDMGRLKMLAGEAAATAAAPEEAPGEPPVVASRADVAGHLRALEEFFRAREPASPIPVLLFRAKTYLEKDFSAVVAELIPAPPQAE